MQGGPRLVLLGGNYTPVNAEATALIARMTIAPNARRKRAIDTLIGALKTAGVWTKLDTFYVMAAHDAASARLNWISTSFNLTAVLCVLHRCGRACGEPFLVTPDSRLPLRRRTDGGRTQRNLHGAGGLYDQRGE
jgi:hypothetical protein